MFGKGRCCVSARPYSSDYLLSGIKDKGGDISKFVIIRLHSFDPKELKRFFKGYYPPYIDELNDREGLINVVQIPMLARLVKIMTIQGRFADPKFQHKMSRTEILKKFVDYVVEEQSKKDKTLNKNILRKRNDYLALLPKLKELSLKTMIAGEIYFFPQSYAEGVLGDALYRAETIEFICPFIDYEHEAVFHREKYHRYQHQIFQEFFTSWGLYELYTGGGKDKLLESLKKLTLTTKKQPRTYMPEVGRFFAEMVELWCENEERDFTYWQNLLMAPDTDDWVRTYALQVRDKLGAGKAKALLDNLFAKENRMLNHSGQEAQYVQIPAGPFIYGSYEYHFEQPVRLISLEAYEIARYPVTNSEFKRFLDSLTRTGKVPADERVGYPEDSKIKWVARSLKIEQGYEKHPVTGITWYGAQAFCAWLRQQDGKDWRVLSELEWEKAARGCLGRRYPWGNAFDKKKCNTRQKGTTLVERYPQGRSPYGCQDMAGNVMECTANQYDEKETVLRGGSWLSAPKYARCAIRYRDYPCYSFYLVGFRCSRTLK